MQERAARLFSTKGKRLEELDASLFATKKLAGAAGGGGRQDAETQVKKEKQRQHDLALLEALVYHFVELVSVSAVLAMCVLFIRSLSSIQEERIVTRENVERKQARTVGEIEEAEEEEAAAEAAAAAAAEDDDDTSDIPYNPKNLPLGWDGKVCMQPLMPILCLINTIGLYCSLFPTGCISCTA